MPPPVADLAGLRAVLAEAEQWVRVPAPAGRNLLIVIAGLPDGTDDTDLARIKALAAPARRRGCTMLIGDWPDGDRHVCRHADTHPVPGRRHASSAILPGRQVRR